MSHDIKQDTPVRPTGADALVGALAQCGVTHCFANPGTSELDIVLALDREPRIRAVPVVFEGVASGAADGFGRMSGRPASTLLHLGPGYLNAAANLHNARRARTPLVNLVGDHATTHRAFDAPLGSDLDAIVRPHSAWVGDVTSADSMASAGVEAVTKALALRGQSALLVTADAAWSRTGASSPAFQAPVARGPDSARVEATARAIRAARHPALILGGWALSDRGLDAASRLAAAGVRVLAETFPARWSRGPGRFAPERLIYFTEMAQTQLGATDLMVLAGAKPPVGYFAYPDKPATAVPTGCEVMTLAGPGDDEAQGLVALADALGARTAASTAARVDIPRATGALNAVAIGTTIGRHLPEHAMFSDDGVTAGQPSFQAAGGAAPHDWMCLTGGALGQGLPLAIGAAMAAPDRKAICLTGDGAMLYTMQALWTMARERLDIVVVVAVNRSYEILRIELARMGAVNRGAASNGLLDLSDPAIGYAKLADGLGVEAMSCDTAEAFESAFASAVSRKGPILIEAVMSA